MATETYLVIVLLAIAVVYVITRVHRALKFRGKMLITCPETGKPAAVKVDISRAVMGEVVCHHRLELCACSRWPGRSDCDQDCLPQLEGDPENHRVWSVASHWYADKKCVYCRKPIGTFSHFDRHPALLSPERKTTEWNQIPAEQLPEAFWASQPVCFSCHILETLIREHPDRVTVRPWKKGGPAGEYVPESRNRPARQQTPVA